MTTVARQRRPHDGKGGQARTRLARAAVIEAAQQGQGQIAGLLAREGALRPELSERDAADIIHALMSPELYRLLVGDRGWDPERYEQWLKEVLIDQLLPHRLAKYLRRPLLEAGVVPDRTLRPPDRPTRKEIGMYTQTEPSAAISRYGSARWRPVGYWLATAVVAGELGLGGIWDIARLPFVADLMTHLGYPSYFLVLLGTWKVLGAFALLIPRRPVLKEWAYAGAFFAYTGAIVSHLVTGYALGEVGLLAVLTVLTVLSWALRPAGRRMWGQTPTAPPVTKTAPRRASHPVSR